MIDDITKREEYRETFWNSKMIKILTCALNGKLNLELQVERLYNLTKKFEFEISL